MTTVAVSGGFSILHAGHVRLIREAANYGDVIVILNSDAWLKRKYGKVIVPYEQREEIMYSIKGVMDVVCAEDDDGTVCKTLAVLKPDYFANGGDRWKHNTPELNVCCDLKIKPLFHVGGNKLNSSSEILKVAND